MKFCIKQAPVPYRINLSVYFSIQYIHINPNLGGLFRDSLWGVSEGGRYPLYKTNLLELYLLEISKLTRKYAYISSFEKYTF